MIAWVVGLAIPIVIYGVIALWAWYRMEKLETRYRPRIEECQREIDATLTSIKMRQTNAAKRAKEKRA